VVVDEVVDEVVDDTARVLVAGADGAAALLLLLFVGRTKVELTA